MKLTRERKAYVAILGLGLAGLACDQLFFGAPAPANGAPAAPAAAPAAEVAVAPAAATMPVRLASGPSLAERLQKAAAWTEAGVADAFLPPSTWAATRQETDGLVTDKPACVAFREKYARALTAVIPTKDGRPGAAVVNKQVVPLHGKVDGFELVDVVELRAIFERDGERVELAIPDDRAPRAGGA